MRKMLRLLAVLAVASMAAACGSVDSPSTLIADDFTGTLDPSGQAFKTFSVSKTGEMQLTLQSLNPRPVVGFIQMAIGTPAGSICSPLLGYIIGQSAVGQQYSFPQIVKGSYCLLITDGNSVLTQPATFTAHLLHP